MITDTLSLRKIHGTVDFDTAGTYKASVVSGTGIRIETPLINLTSMPVNTKLIASFVVPDEIANKLGDSIVANIPSPGIHIIRANSETYMTSKSLFPILHDQGLLVNLVSLNDSMNGGTITVTDPNNEQMTLELTTEIQVEDVTYDASGNDTITYLPPRMLLVKPLDELDQALSLDINIAYYGERDDRKSLWLPAITGTSLNFSNLPNKLEGYLAASEMLSDQNSTGIMLEPGDYIYMATVDSSSYQPNVFTDDDALAIAQATPAINGNKVRWLVVAFNNYSGFVINSPVCYKVYHITTVAKCVNWYRTGTVDNFHHDNGVVSDEGIDHTWIMPKALTDKRTYLPSMLARTLGIKLTTLETNANINIMQYDEVIINKVGDDIRMYIPSALSNLDTRSYDGLGKAFVYKIIDPTLWEDIKTLTHVNIYYEPKGGDETSAGVATNKSLILNVSGDGSTVICSYNTLDEADLTLASTDIETSLLSQSIENMVMLPSSDVDKIHKVLRNIGSVQRHYHRYTTPLTIVPNDTNMVQSGQYSTDNMEILHEGNPRVLDGKAYLRQIFINRSYSNHKTENHTWGVNIETGDSTEVNLYFMIRVLPEVGTMPSNSQYIFTVLDTDGAGDSIYQASEPGGLVKLIVLPGQNKLRMIMQSNSSDHTLDNIDTGTALVNLKLSNTLGSIKAELFIGGDKVHETTGGVPWTHELSLHSDAYKLGANETHVSLYNFAFYPRGTATTSHTFLPFTEIKEGDTPEVDRVSWIRKDTTVANDYVTKATLLVPKFFMDDNPFAEGLYTIELPDNHDNDDLFSMIYGSVKFVYLVTHPTGSPLTPEEVNRVTSKGQTTLTLDREEGGGITPLAITGQAWTGDAIRTSTVTSLLPTIYLGETSGSYDETVFTVVEDLPVNKYALETILQTKKLSSMSTLPLTISPKHMYLHQSGTTVYLIMATGILIHDEYNTTTSVFTVTGDVADLPDITDWYISSKPVTGNIPANIPASISPKPPNATSALLIATKDTLKFSIRLSQSSGSSFKWATSDLTNTDDGNLPRLGKNLSQPIIDVSMRAIPGTVLDKPRLLTIVSYEDISDVPSSISPRLVILTQENSKPVLLLASAWLSTSGNDNSIVKYELTGSSGLIDDALVQALHISKYIIVDPTANDGNTSSLGTTETGVEVFALIRNLYAGNPDYSSGGFTLTYSYVKNDNSLANKTWDNSASNLPGYVTSESIGDIALPYARYIRRGLYPHGVIKYGNDTGGVLSRENAYVEENVAGSVHRIGIKIPAAAFFYNVANDNMLNISFDLIDEDPAAYSTSVVGVCVSPSETEAIAADQIYRKGNIVIVVPRSGTLSVLYYTGSSWNDMLDITVEGIIGGITSSTTPLSIASCSTMKFNDDIFHRPVIMRNRHRLTEGGLAGNEILTTLDYDEVSIILPSIWLTLNPGDTGTVRLIASDLASIAVHNAKVVVMYSGSKFGTIAGLPVGDTGTQTVILSRTDTGAILHILKDGIIVHQEDLTSTESSINVASDPIIPASIPTYVGGFLTLTQLIGVAEVVPRIHSELDQQYVTDISYTVLGSNAWIYVPSYVLSGNKSDPGVYKITIDDVSLRSVLATNPLVCLFNGPVSSVGIDLNSETRVYIGTPSLDKITIVYNNIGDPYTTLDNLDAVPTGISIPPAINHNFLKCDDNIGCDMAIQSANKIESIPINCIKSLIGNTQQAYEVDASSVLMHNIHNGAPTPVNMAISVEPFTDAECIAVTLDRSPRGETSSGPVGLQTSKCDFIIGLISDEPNRVNYFGLHSIPTTMSPGILVHFSRYPGIPVVISNSEVGDKIALTTIKSISVLDTTTANTKDIIGGKHTITISLVKTGLGTFIYVYEKGDLIAYTTESIPWFVPSTMVLHFHSNSPIVSSELITDPIISSNTTGLSCLPAGGIDDVDCLNKYPNVSVNKSLSLNKDTTHLVSGLVSISEYGYFHITLTNPTLSSAVIRLYSSDKRNPQPQDEIEESGFTLPPGGVKEIPTVLIRMDHKLFAESNVTGITLRVFTMENVRKGA